jgi:hypothetical protein
MLGEGEKGVDGKEGAESGQTQEEKNRDQISSMFDEDRINPSAEGKEKTAEAEMTDEERNSLIKEELEGQADSQKEEYFSNKIKGARSFEDLEAINKEMGSIKSTFDNETIFDAEGMKARIDDIRRVYSKLGKEAFDDALKLGGFLEYAKQYGLGDKIIELLGKELEGGAAQESTKGGDAGENTFDETKGMTAEEIRAALKDNTKSAENPENSESKKKSLREIGHDRIADMAESGKKIGRDILEGAKNILNKGRTKWENIKKGISDSRKWLEDQTGNMGTAALEFAVGSIEAGVQKTGAAYEKGKQIGAAGVEGAKAAAETAVGAAYEGGRLAKKGVEIVIDKAAEKIKLLEERGAEAFENLSSRTRSAINKFREYRNQKRLENVDQKYWKKIGGLNTKIAELEILRKNLKEGDIKNLGRLSTKIAELQIKKEGIERRSVIESTEEKPDNVFDLGEFRAKKQEEAEAQEPGSMREAV